MKNASWVIVENVNGGAVFETFSEKTANAINTEKYTAVPIMEYLSKLNRQIKNSGVVSLTIQRGLIPA